LLKIRSPHRRSSLDLLFYTGMYSITLTPLSVEVVFAN
jgi:hypothetical protein